MVAVALSAAMAAPGRGQGVFGGISGLVPVSPPQFESQGVWARVLSVTPKWIVLENAAGQQYPVAVDSIRLFAIRWPADPRLAAPGTLAEVTGFDANSGRLLTNRVDLYEGDAQQLVTPTSIYLSSYNRVMLPLTPFQAANPYGQSELLPGETILPLKRHVVGPMLSGSPLLVGVGGNDILRVLPGAGGLTVSRVTIGSPSFVKPGDIAWSEPIGSDPRSLILGQLIIHKAIPIEQYVP